MLDTGGEKPAATGAACAGKALPLRKATEPGEVRFTRKESQNRRVSDPHVMSDGVGCNRLLLRVLGHAGDAP